MSRYPPGASGRDIVISTHFDDGALSVSGTILALGTGATVVTVHGGGPASADELSGWDAACGFLSGQEAAAVRRAEDIASCSALGVRYRHLPYPDSPYIHDERVADDIRADLVSVMSGAGTVFVPAAIGGNPDHVQARDLALSAARDRPGLAVILYADLPYAASARDWGEESFGATDPAGELFGSLRSVADRYWLSVPELLRIAAPLWPKKRTAVLSHASQLPPLARQYRDLTAYPGPLGYELTWRVFPKSAGCPAAPTWLPATVSAR